MESLLKNLEKHVTCSICLENYTKPKTIHCLHTFCCECLEKHARASHRNGKFRCPECQAQVDLPEGNRFDKLPTSFLHNSLLSLLAVRQSSDGAELTCNNCTKASSELHYCFECEQFLCPICLNAHQLTKKATEGHRVISVKDFQAEDYQALLKRQPFCPQKYHKREVMQFYCRPCQTSICQICIITDHKTHDVVPLDKAADEEKVNILATVELVKEKGKFCSDVIRQLETTIVEVDANINTAIRKASQTTQQIISKAQKNEREVITALENIRETRLQRLNSVVQQVRSLMTQTNQAVAYADALVQGSSSPDIMQTKTNVEQRAQQLCNTNVPSLPVTSFVEFIPTCEPDSLRLGFVLLKKLTIENLSHNIQAGLQTEFTVCLENAEGEINDRNSKDQIEVVVEPTEEVSNLTVCERNEGHFQVKFTPQIPGAYRIKMKMNGGKLPNSPLTVQVKERQFLVVGELNLKGEMLQQPRGIAVNSEGSIAVTDVEGNRVLIFDRDGKYVTKLGCYGNKTGQLICPADVTYLNDDEILVVDSENHRIQRFNLRTGKCVKSFGKHGTAEGEFQYPSSVCMDDEGHVVVTDCDNNRIQVLTKDGEPVLSFGDSGPEKIKEPCSCVPHMDKFIVCDTCNHSVKVFDKSGQFLYKIGEQGQADGQLNAPFDSCVNSSGHLLICDMSNNRIQQFTLDGRFTGKSLGLQRPWGITTTPDGRILVSDGDAKKIYVLK